MGIRSTKKWGRCTVEGDHVSFVDILIRTGVRRGCVVVRSDSNSHGIGDRIVDTVGDDQLEGERFTGQELRNREGWLGGSCIREYDSRSGGLSPCKSE